MRDRPYQHGTCSGPEGDPLCAEPVARDIIEGICQKQVCQQDR